MFECFYIKESWASELMLLIDEWYQNILIVPIRSHNDYLSFLF